jgi:hypothetical protein
MTTSSIIHVFSGSNRGVQSFKILFVVKAVSDKELVTKPFMRHNYENVNKL